MTGGCSVNKGSKDQTLTDAGSLVAITPDSIAKKNLSEDLTAILFTPDSVMAAKLSESVSSNQFSKVKEYVANKPMQSVSGKELQAVQLLLLSDGKNYSNDTIIVMSPCIPAMVMNFYKDGKMASIKTSFSDHSWILEQDGKSILHYNYVVSEPFEMIYNNLK